MWIHPAEMRGLRNPAHFVEGDLYIWVFVVIEVIAGPIQVPLLGSRAADYFRAFGWHAARF
jgi:hypothetical protein